MEHVAGDVSEQTAIDLALHLISRCERLHGHLWSFRGAIRILRLSPTARRRTESVCLFSASDGSHFCEEVTTYSFLPLAFEPARARTGALVGASSVSAAQRAAHTRSTHRKCEGAFLQFSLFFGGFRGSETCILNYLLVSNNVQFKNVTGQKSPHIQKEKSKAHGL